MAVCEAARDSRRRLGYEVRTETEFDGAAGGLADTSAFSLIHVHLPRVDSSEALKRLADGSGPKGVMSYSSGRSSGLNCISAVAAVRAAATASAQIGSSSTDLLPVAFRLAVFAVGARGPSKRAFTLSAKKVSRIVMQRRRHWRRRSERGLPAACSGCARIRSGTAR